MLTGGTARPASSRTVRVCDPDAARSKSATLHTTKPGSGAPGAALHDAAAPAVIPESDHSFQTRSTRGTAQAPNSWTPSNPASDSASGICVHSARLARPRSSTASSSRPIPLRVAANHAAAPLAANPAGSDEDTGSCASTSRTRRGVDSRALAPQDRIGRIAMRASERARWQARDGVTRLSLLEGPGVARVLAAIVVHRSVISRTRRASPARPRSIRSVRSSCRLRCRQWPPGSSGRWPGVPPAAAGLSPGSGRAGDAGEAPCRARRSSRRGCLRPGT